MAGLRGLCEDVPMPVADAALSQEGAAMLRAMWSALGEPAALLERVRFTGEGELPSVYPVTDLAAASVAVAALSMAALVGRRSGNVPAVRVDRVLASRWFARSIQPLGWAVPPPWDPIAGDYEARDGWIRLHTNAPHHRGAALVALGLNPDDGQVAREQVAAAVRGAGAGELEAAVVGQGGCAAAMRGADDWARHPQGAAVRAEPLLAIGEVALSAAPAEWPLRPRRPLEGIRVLDLTRILAGPVATRFLAGYGAQVLRIDPPGWDEPAAAPEVTLGKRRARLDLKRPEGVAAFERLLAQADVLVHGYRADALERLGLGERRRRELNPALVDVSLDAYGWTGEWRTRRGFDSLVQMSAGIAEAGMTVLGRPAPTPLPVQALDHATGYLLAAAVLRGLARRIDDGAGSSARTSLARMAALLTGSSTPRRRDAAPLPAEQPNDYAGGIEQTAWGPAKRLRPPCAIEGTTARWTLPAGRLGDGEAAW